MKTVIIMRGIPGSGKSSQAEILISAAKNKNQSTKYCSADQFFIKNGLYRFEPHLVGNAHIFCMSKFLTAMQNDIDLVVVDNTHTSCWEYTPYMQVALCNGYTVQIIEVHCDQKVAFKRQTHGVPEKQHKSMDERFQRVLPHHKQFLTVKQTS